MLDEIRTQFTTDNTKEDTFFNGQYVIKLSFIRKDSLIRKKVPRGSEGLVSDFLVFIQNRLLSGGLEPVLIHTKKRYV